MNRIKELREKIGMTAKELAEQVGVSPSMMMYYEKGASTPKDNETWLKMAKIFNVSIPHVMGLSVDANLMEIPDNHSVESAVNLFQTMPISYTVETGSELEVLNWLPHLDKDDKESVAQLVQKLVKQGKYK
jgi:transcriptional regulator with XRE-family HTH domain